MAASAPQTMEASLAVVQASGAPCLELPTPKAGARVHFGNAVQELSPMLCSQDGSPMCTSTAPASPWSPVTPMVGTSSAFFPAPGGAGLRLCSGHADGQRASFQGLDMSPKSPAASPTMSPGAQIRRNAYRLGIPLNLQVQGILAPVPVATSGPDGAEEVLAPSPHSGSAPMQVELPKEPAAQQQSTKKVPQNIALVARPSAGRFSGA